MENLNFFSISDDYVKFLQSEETKARGFSRVPNTDYGDSQKEKFLCGVVLRVNDFDYYVPVSSYKKQQPDNFLVKNKYGKIVGSLRFNYMFPVPKKFVAEKEIAKESDPAYRALLSQELRYCIKNQAHICSLAERTYKRVLLGKNLGLVRNSCDFPLLEKKMQEYIRQKETSKAEAALDALFGFTHREPDEDLSL